MLPDYGVVQGALADEELAFEVFGLVDKGGAFKALRVGLRGVHVALSVHDLVPFPVDDGAAGNAHLEGVRVGGHEADGHETAVAPAVNANTGGIHIGQALEPIDAHHLVFHLRLAALPVDGFLEGGAPVLGAAVVLHVHQIAFLCHEHFPHADLSQPAVLHHLAVRAAIDIEDDGVFFSRVEVLGIDEPIVILELAVCAGNGAQLHLAGGVTFQRIIGLMHFLVYFSVRGAAVNLVGGGGVGPGIQEPLAVRRELDMVPAAAAGELHGLIELGLFDGVFPGQFKLHLVQVVLHGRILGRGVIHVGAVVVHIVDIGRCRGQAAKGAQGVHQVEVPEAVPVVCAIEEKVCAALDEIDGILGLHPGLIVFRKKGAHKVAGGGVVLV